MLVKTQGIILHIVRYGDQSLILTVYTEEFGRQSYIMNGTRGPKSKNRAGILQPLYMLDLEVYQKKNPGDSKNKGTSNYKSVFNHTLSYCKKQ